MTAKARANRVKQLADAEGFDLCGIAPAREIAHGDYLRSWLSAGMAGTMGYLHRHVASRVDVRAWLPATRSVIVVGLSYRQDEVNANDDVPRGRAAMYSWGQDYHVVLREKLERLVGRMREAFGVEFEARVCVDTSAVVERELAAMAGIGWIGKNTLVLNAGVGSYFFLGEILTDLELTADEPVEDHCGTCTRCLDACPTGAFPEPYKMDARRCISYLTIEHRGGVEADLAAKMGDWVFGCDVCQQVCPHNHDAPLTKESRLKGSKEHARPRLDEIIAWSEAEYAKHVAGRAGVRARRAMWHRNATIARANMQSGLSAT